MTEAIPDPALGLAVCAALQKQVARLGLSIGDEPTWSALVFHPEVDPYSKAESLVGQWQGQPRTGLVTIFPDGRIFAEYQVLQAHPTRDDCYVESVQVWGRPGALKGDPVIREWGS